MKQAIICGTIIASLISLNAFAASKYAYWQTPSEPLRGRDTKEETTPNPAINSPVVNSPIVAPAPNNSPSKKPTKPNVKDSTTPNKSPKKADNNLVTKAKKPTKAIECQCVKYVKNRIGDQTSAGNAKDMAPYLVKNGYSQVLEAPRRRDIVIFNPKFGHGFNQSYGHVAVVNSASVAKDGTITISMSGANMHLAHERTEHSCKNVSTSSVSIKPTEKPYVKFFRR